MGTDGANGQDLPARDATKDAEAFNEHRGLLVAVAYRVLGRHADAEDVVQDAWLRWSGIDTSAVEDPQAYLVTVTTRLAIDQLRRAQTRKESYVGSWLPEPMVTDALRRPGAVFGSADAAADDRAVRDDTVSMAMLAVMESLSPLERAVFVLREAFDYGYPEIAKMLDRTEPAVRQLVTRARAHVQERRPRFPVDDAARRRISENFLAACNSGSLEPLMATLAPGVTLTADGGGVTASVRHPLHGAADVAKFLLAIVAYGAKRIEAGMDAAFLACVEPVNGDPAVAIVVDGELTYLYVLDLEENGLVRGIYAVANPPKLERVRQLTYRHVTGPGAPTL